ncbi:MAG: glucose-1-phosphate thymidylyltransferase RfbA [Bdellovibrionales bacterium]|nr:glucose-1-phosphate thymidylyltransferase RfbA [Bdellovibrionales bacterium]
MKGIILAGGSGTRLLPMTQVVSKQLLPVYDKPVIYYPLSTLMLAGIKEILIISTPRDLPMIEGLLGNGAQIGLKLSYLAQAKPEGIAQAFIIGADFIGNEPVCMILGDNLFYSNELHSQLQQAASLKSGATVFAYRVQDPERYGVVEFGSDKRVVSVEEKPKNPKSPWAITGLYFYDNTVVRRARSLKPSARGEFEITDLNQTYLKDQALHVEKMGRGVAWLDMGTPDSLLSSSQFVQTIENRQGMKIACIEEIALHMGFINQAQLASLIEKLPQSDYCKYLKRVLSESAEV